MRRAILIAIITIGILVVALAAGLWWFPREDHVLICTWNVHGYPEPTEERQKWFSEKLTELNPDIICVQEIANQERVDDFLANEIHFTKAAFKNFIDGQNNAIFTTDRIDLIDIADPNGFQDPTQAVFVAYRGFDAVIVTVHLSFTNNDLRETKIRYLKDVVEDMLKIDPDVIIVGDFNLTGHDIEKLAQVAGLRVMIPPGQDGVGTSNENNRYDHFLISPDLANEEAISCKVHIPSDEAIAFQVLEHRPVLAVFSADAQYRDSNRERRGVGHRKKIKQ